MLSPTNPRWPMHALREGMFRKMRRGIAAPSLTGPYEALGKGAFREWLRSEPLAKWEPTLAGCSEASGKGGLFLNYPFGPHRC